ncbi:MAG TPA: hypothetical protein VIS77_04325 [Burkholderiales bacterium]
MTLETARQFFLWCLLVNYGILVLWAFAILFARDQVRRLHGRWFRLTDEQFDLLHYGGMGLYKLLIFVFNLAPWIALTAIR